MNKRNVALVVCGLLLLAVSAWVRLRAQSCTGGYQNFGILQQYYCTYGAVQCQGNVCESDLRSVRGRPGVDNVLRRSV